MTVAGNPDRAWRAVRRLGPGVMAVCCLCVAGSCSQSTAPKNPETSTGKASFTPKKFAPTPAEPKTPGDNLSAELSKLINDVSLKYKSLEYQYDEGLLNILDQAEAHLAGKSNGPAPRAMPRLSEQEEYDHLRETIRRWHAKSGKDLRAEIDPLKAEVAARKPGGPAFHPDFHRKFAAVFDDFIPIEVQEIRERRNRALHEQAQPLLDKYRSTSPDIVTQHEKTLNAPPYNLPESTSATSPTSSNSTPPPPGP